MNEQVGPANPTTAVAAPVERGIQGLLKQAGVQQRIKEVLGDGAATFASSVIAVSQSSKALAQSDPATILFSCMSAATLNLPVNKDLGFAHIVPYGGKAQLQIGYKGFIQLAMRTGQYVRMNATAVNKEAFGGFDEVGEPIIDWSKLDASEEAVGYAFAFKMVNGFVKIAYWSREKVEIHAKKFSQAYKNGGDTPWKTNFEAMALKTVIKNTLSKWGYLSIQMQKAIQQDQAVIKNVDGDVEYIDGTPEAAPEPQAPKPLKRGPGRPKKEESPQPAAGQEPPPPPPVVEPEEKGNREDDKEDDLNMDPPPPKGGEPETPAPGTDLANTPLALACKAIAALEAAKPARFFRLATEEGMDPESWRAEPREKLIEFAKKYAV
jgi:recombination protein RecT